MDKIKLSVIMLRTINNINSKHEVNEYCKNIVRHYAELCEYLTLESTKKDYLELAEYCLDIAAKRATLLGGDTH